ncbi:MAG: bifunctional glutamate N-acetyltransferase/amino-acid acetyltransferase ArgJ [Candidatus Omnitrophica bacterium]|nr:bifunctional glutamate N-acetyltransferase/amino-acid acetyltransferase ArgJ [Candidatus Omnitrophota bacterium]
MKNVKFSTSVMSKHVLPKGFLANGIHCGLKKKRKDLALFYSEKPCKCAALFTRNVVKAAPVILAQRQLRKNGNIRAIIVNSGNANCMTGTRGMADAERTAAETAAVLKIRAEEVLVSSTGVIGRPLRMTPLVEGLPGLADGLSADGLIHAAEGMMTTDRFPKVASRTFTAGDKRVTITGAAKGAGMICPDMATMLCYVLTDADITEKALVRALSASNEVSFRAITVDGDMSTNDTLALLANGEAKNRPIKERGGDFKVFLSNLNAVTVDLAKMIVRDGEGATRFMEVTVRGARTKAEAEKGASAIANSLLVKCAVHGGDPNWGRVASSLGSSGIRLKPDSMDIILDGVTFFKEGRHTSPGKKRAQSVFKKKDVRIETRLHQGNAEASVYTCDISKKYIKINSLYTT